MTTDRTLHVRPAVALDREALENLWLLFRHDMSAVDGALPDARGRFRDERLRAALAGPGWLALLTTIDAAPVGFALVRGVDGPVRVMSSFFVVAAARRTGVGMGLARHAIGAMPGRWEIPFQDANAPAGAFWHRVADDVAKSGWTLEHRPVPGRPDIAPDAWVGFTTR